MPSSYSTNLKIELQATGENSGTWGTITNTNLGTALEQAIVGYGNPSYASDANLTLTYTDTNAAQAARALVLNVTSAVSLTNTRELVVPTIQKQYIVQNNTTGSQSITVKTSGGTGITVPNGRKAHLYVNGTDVIYMDDYVDINGGAIDGTPIGANSASTGAFTTLSASGNITVSGGTANGVLYLNGSKVATSGSALQFSGTNLGIGGAASMYWSGANVGMAIAGSTNGAEIDLKINGGTSTSYFLQDLSSNLRLGNQGNFPIIFQVSDAEQMRLTSTGLGIGTSSPGYKLEVNGIIAAKASSANAVEFHLNNTNASARDWVLLSTGSSWAGGGQTGYFNIYDNTAGQQRLTIDTSGNLGLGVTPSAWGTQPAIQQLGGALWGVNAANYEILQNAFYNGTNYIYRNTNLASRYNQNAGVHSWFTAASGTAGNAITFTQAMTLDASGRLGVGLTNPSVTFNVDHASHGVGMAYMGASALPTIAGLFTDSSSGQTGYGSLLVKARSDFGGFYSINFYTASSNNTPTERARITSDGNLVIGATSTSRRLQVNTSLSTAYDSGNMETTSLSTRIVNTDGTTGNYTGIHFATSNNSDAAIAAVRTADASMALTFGTRNVGSGNIVERARITSGGELCINRTSGLNALLSITSASGNGSINCGDAVDGTAYGIVQITRPADQPDNKFHLSFIRAGQRIAGMGFLDNSDTFAIQNDGSNNGSGVTLTASATSWGTTSDERKKNILGSVDNAMAKMASWRSVYYRYKIDKEDAPQRIGLIAQDVQATVPEAVSVEDDEGGTLQLRYSEVIPVLVKAIQEQQAMIKSLEAKVAALEAK